MPKLDGSFNSRVAELASHGATLHIHRTRKIGDHLFRVWMTTAGYRSEPTQSEMADNLQRSVGEAFRVLPESVGPRVAPSARERIYSALLTPNLAVKPMPEDLVKAGLTVVTANLFRDAGDQLWKRVVTDGIEQIVQTSKDNFEEILSARRSTGATPVLAAIEPTRSSSGAKPGDWVTFVDAARRTWNQGYLVASDEGLSVVNEDGATDIDPDQLVEHDAGDLHVAELAAATPKANFRSVIEYIKKLYGANSPVYQRLKAMIEQRNAMA